MKFRRTYIYGAVCGVMGILCVCVMSVIVHNVKESQRIASNLIAKGATVSWNMLGEISELREGGATLTDDDFSSLSKLRGLKRLNLANSKITDAGMAHIGAVDGLEWLSLDGCEKITAAGVKEIQGLTNLRELNLSGNQNINDDAIIHLKGMTKLKTLYLRDTSVSDNGLAPLAGNKQLRNVLVRRTKMTADGVTQLKRELPQLEFIDGQRVVR